MMRNLELKLDKKIPISLRNEFWIQLLKSIEDVILLMRTDMERKIYIYSVLYSEKEDLYDFAQIVFRTSFQSFLNLENSLRIKYGFSSDETELLLRRELSKIPFQTSYKGSLELYKSVFNLYKFSFPFQLTIYTTSLNEKDPVSGEKRVIRNLYPFLRMEDTFTLPYTLIDSDGNEIGDSLGILGILGYVPHIIQESDNNFLGIQKISDPPSLDHPDSYTFDEYVNLISRLDNESFESVRGTRHIAFEVVATNKYLKEDIDVLFPYDVMQYIKENILYYKRAAEVPHIGIQYSVLIDNTGYWDIFSSEDLKENMISNSEFDQDIIWIKGSQWSIENGKAIRASGGSATSITYPSFKHPIGTTLRFNIKVDVLNGPLEILDGEGTVKYTLYNPDLYEFDLDWNSDSSGISFKSSGEVELDSIEIRKANRYSNPNTLTRSASHIDYLEDGINTITHIEFGSGSKRLPMQGDITYDFPSSLDYRLATIVPLEEEVFLNQNEDFIGAIAEYNGQLINHITLHDDSGPLLESGTSGAFGTDKIFKGFLPEEIVSLKPRTVVFALKDPTQAEESQYIDFIEDNGSGVLIGKEKTFFGNINYITGEYELTSEFITPKEKPFPDMEVAVIDFSGTLSEAAFVDKSTLLFSYEGKQYYILVNEDESLTSNFPYFEDSTSFFDFGVIESTFQFDFTEFVKLSDIRFLYQKEQNTTYASKYELELFRAYTNKPYSITEIGVYGTTISDSTPKMLSYITCAPIELFSNEFHLNFGVILEK